MNKAALGAAVIVGMAGFASAGASLPLKPGFAVHTMGVSPDADRTDGNATVRIYDTTGRGYSASRPTADFSDTFSDNRWNIDTIGNVYGIAIDKDRNIYVTASANWSPGYVGTGDSGNNNVPVKYGERGGGETNASAGVVYKLDATTGKPTVFARLPQKRVTITNQVCQGNGRDVLRQNVGAGLGNIAYDKFHDQYFVSNFSDGKIYRLDHQGNILQTFNDRGFAGIINGTIVKAPYGLAVSPDGHKLYYGTINTDRNTNDRYQPQIYSVALSDEGNITGMSRNEHAALSDDLFYTQNIGGKEVGDGVWAAYSDLTFTPDDELMVGVRVGCKGNFATSYNHGGIVYLLKKDGDKYNMPSDKTSQGSTAYTGEPNGLSERENRAGNTDNDDYNYDSGAIPLHYHDKNNLMQERLEYGPDDGYGGVAFWQKKDGSVDLYATSSDITTRGGVHGFMQFGNDFTITEHATLDKAIGYKAVASSTTYVPGNDETKYDYKGIGGDVEVLSVVPVSIGSYVWEDSDKDGIQESNEPYIDGAKVSLLHQERDGTFKPAIDLDGKRVADQTTGANGIGGGYLFDNLPEGNYRVCVTPPVVRGVKFDQTRSTAVDNDDAEDDSNFADGNCSGIFTLVANSEPKESGAYTGDDQDDTHDTWGNMTVDFGYIKNVFDLALIKTLDGNTTRKYKPGEDVNFTITVTNQGDIEAKDVVVMDYIPEGLELHDDNWTQQGDQAVRNEAIPSIAPGSSQKVTIRFRVDPNLRNDEDFYIVNVAEIKAASNDFNLSDRDSTPGDRACFDAIDERNDTNYWMHDNNITETNGCDDIDPAAVPIQHYAISPLTDTPGGGDEGSPECDCAEEDKADAMGRLALLLMFIGTLVAAIRFLPRDEQVA